MQTKSAKRGTLLAGSYACAYEQVVAKGACLAKILPVLDRRQAAACSIDGCCQQESVYQQLLIGQACAWFADMPVLDKRQAAACSVDGCCQQE